MIPALVHVRPLDLVTNTRVDIRLGSALNTEAYGLNGQFWEPALRTRPRISQDLFSPDMDGKFQLATADLTIALMEMKQADWTRLYWEGAEVSVYRVTDLNWPLRKIEFTGLVKNAPMDLDQRGVRLNCESDKTRVSKPLLTGEFTGGGGILGDAGKRGVLWPAGFGVCESIEIVWFDETYNIGMIDGYGNLTSVQKLMEGLSDMGAAVADYASYALLKAAIIAKTVPPGRWGTCIAEGLIGLGAPPVGRITANATFGHVLPGAIMKRWIDVHADVDMGTVDTSSFDDLDTAVPFEMRMHYTAQQQVDDLIEGVCRDCNASPMIRIDGKIAVTRAIATTPVATLNKNNQTSPTHTDWQAADPITPAYRIILRAARPGVVLTYDEVNYVDDLIDRGLYDGAETYRAGNLVWRADGSQYLYTYATPTAGNAPPTPPTTSNTWWQRTVQPTEVDWDTGIVGDGKPEDYATSADNMVINGSLADNAAHWDLAGGVFLYTVPAGDKVPFALVFPTAGAGTEAYANDNSLIPLSGAPAFFVSGYSGRDGAATELGIYVAWYQADGSVSAILSDETRSILPSTTLTFEPFSVKFTPPADAVSFKLSPFGNGNVTQTYVGGIRVAKTEPVADVTVLIEGPTAATLPRDYAGALKMSVLPKTFVYKMMRAGLDVTSLSSFAATVLSGTASFSWTGGALELTDSSPASKLLITGTLAGSERSLELVIGEIRDPPPAAGSGGTAGTVDFTSSIANTSSTSYGSSNARILTAKAGLSGVVTLTFPGQFYKTSNGTLDAYGKWQWRVVGGVFADVGSEELGGTANKTGAPDYENDPGYLSLTRSKTGLTSGVDYEFQLLLRNAAAGTATWTGTATASGS